jgi:site-specific recombinase XerD
MGKTYRTQKETRRRAQTAPLPVTLPSNIVDLFRDYQLSLEALGRSPKTISSYFEILERFFSFLISECILKPVTELGRHDLNKYLIYLQSCRRWPNRPKNRADTDRLSPFTIQDHARTVKAFWGWLLREEYVKKNPLEKFPLPSVPKVILKIITPEIFTKLLALIDRTTPKGFQHYCIMLVLYDSGLRVSELTMALIENIDFKLGFIRVVGKGNKQRDVPLSQLTIREIRRYTNEFRPRIRPLDSPYLFPRSDGKAISVTSVQQFLRRLAKKSGYENLRLHPHLLRHTFGTQFIINGGNAFYLKEIMGHASLSTTLKYTHLQSEDLRREHAKFSPVGNLRIGKRI